MGYNSNFVDKMDNINNFAQGYGFKNGIEWANVAQKRGEISYSQYKKYENAHNLRVRFSHGNAKDIDVSYETYQLANEFESDIERSSIRKNTRGGHNGETNGGGNNSGPKLPPGFFRGNPYVKEFNRTGKDGEEYFFKLAIYKENNYLDNGNGGAIGFGYFIHIYNAPYFQYASEKLHEFHLIKTSSDYHICWNKLIDGFEEANAVMFVWVNRYTELIDVLKSNNLISESQLVQKANKKHVLPSGTFRGKQNNKNNTSTSHMKTVYMTENVFDQIMSILGKNKPELGGMLGFTMDQNTIDTYVFDYGAKVNDVEYKPNIEYLQTIIEGEWDKKHIFLGGFVHSHPGDFNRLSYADVEYAQRIMDAFDLSFLFMPIVTSSYRYKTSLTGYIVNSNGKVERCNVSVVPGETINEVKHTPKLDENKETKKEDVIDPELIKMIEAGFDAADKKKNSIPEKPDSIKAENISIEDKTQLAHESTFVRISGAIDIPYMTECSVIGIGCGGSRYFYESMARIGVGNFFLIDGDKASYSNIATQNVYISEIGMFKPELTKKKLLDINEKVQVTCFDFMLTDEIEDEFIEQNIISKIDKKKTVICAFTDSFFAQARISRIALKYGIPFLAGQHHAEGTVSEVIFWYPKITKYSMREIAKSRYKEFEKGYKNSVTSDGSPIFNTTRLNALCEKIALGLLMYNRKPDHIYCSFLNRMSDKNLILIKQRFIDEEHPLYDFFDNGINSLFDEVSWIHPESIENLDNTLLEEDNIHDTRTIFKTEQ